MELNSLDILLKTLDGANVDSHILKKDGSDLKYADHELRGRLFKDYTYNGILEFLKKVGTPGTLLLKTDQFQFSYLFLYIPVEYLADDESSFLVIGPFTKERKTGDEIYQIMLENGIPARLFNEISVFYDSIPVMKDTDSFYNIILRLCTGLFGMEYHMEHFPTGDPLFPEDHHTPGQIQFDPQLARAIIAERYDVENEMMAAVSAGDYEKAHAAALRFDNYQIRPRAKDQIRNKQHLAVIQNTLLRKAAEIGGVHPLYIDDLSTRFAVRINEVSTLSELELLCHDMTHKYCLLVKNYAMKGYSPVIKEIISYIDFHYSEDLNLNFFSSKFNITKTYLSNLFKKETGSTLTDFIHQVRMRKAITLINSSSIPITAIATACGYNDINYFIRMFKRNYGLSPKQYQKMIAQKTAVYHRIVG